mgnify:CR=1 FL=1
MMGNRQMDDLEKANEELQTALVDQMHADSLLASANARVIACRDRVHRLFRQRMKEIESRREIMRKSDVPY